MSVSFANPNIVKHFLRYYEATIESLDGDEVSVLFNDYKSAEATTLEFIKELPHGQESTAKAK